MVGEQLRARRPGRFRGRAFGRWSPVAGWSAAIAAAALLVAVPRLEARETTQPGFGQRAVASESKEAAREAMAVLRAGGSAADAAVVAALVAGLAAPGSSGIGGGGFALSWEAAHPERGAGRPWLLDFRETAPQAVDVGAFERRPLPPEARGKLVGVPGEVRGLFTLHERSGKLRWAELVGRAAKQARLGFVVGPHLAKLLGYGEKHLATQPSFAALYYPGGKPAVVGTRVVNPKLAATLERVAAEGPAAFYEGTLAQEIVDTARSAGGALTTDELAAYRAVERQPLRVRWEGYDVYTMPPPSAGGLMLVETLKMFSADELRHLGHGSPAYQHLVAEALRGAIADRMRFVGDPDHQNVDLKALLDDRRLAARRRSISLERTHALPRFGLEEHGTHHLVTSDRDGNVISLTTTVNRLFGAKLMTEQSGVVLNDELDDFTAQRAVAPFGMTESPNRPRPGARPVSSMTPTLAVRDGKPVLALGGSGGPTIATNVTQMFLAALVFDQSPSEALSKPRIYVPTDGPSLLYEEATPEHLDSLRWRGEVVAEMPFKTSGVQMVRFDGARVEAAADPRKHGTALVE